MCINNNNNKNNNNLGNFDTSLSKKLINFEICISFF